MAATILDAPFAAPAVQKKARTGIGGTLAAALLAVFGLIGGLGYLAASGQNQVALEREKALAETAIDSQIALVASTVHENAFWDDPIINVVDGHDLQWAEDNTGASITDNAGLYATFIIGRDDKTISTYMDHKMQKVDAFAWAGDAARQLAAEARAGRPDEVDPKSVIVTLGEDKKPYILVAGAYTFITASQKDHPQDPAKRGVLLVAKPIDEKMLADIGHSFLLDDPLLDTAAVPVGGAATAIRGAKGNVIAWLTWTPHRPGTELMAWLLPCLLGACFLIALMTGRAAFVWADAMSRLFVGEDQLAALMEGAADFIFGFDGSGMIVSMNRAAKNAMEDGDKERRIVDFLRAPDGGPVTLDKLIGMSAVSREFLLRGKKLAPVEVSVNRVERSRKPLFMVIARDLTERKAQEKMRLAKEAAEAQARAKSRFLATISHELRTPLNAIMGFAQIIRDREAGAEVDVYAEFGKEIHFSGERLMEVINDMIEYVELDGDEGVSEPDRVVDPANILRGCVRAIAPTAEAKGLSVALKMGEMPQLLVDERRLHKMLMKLAVNAVKFTDQGGIEIGAAMETDGRPRLYVRDTGCGMDEDQLRTAAAGFRAGESTLTQVKQGMGLGLAIVKAMTETHGGEMEIVSAQGKGTTISILLPTRRVIGAA